LRNVCPGITRTPLYDRREIWNAGRWSLGRSFSYLTFSNEKEEVGFLGPLMVFSVFKIFNARISIYDTLQSCPRDNFPPYRHFRITIEK
jgi:hypothetical protein